MSYDFILFPVVEGEDPLETAHRKWDGDAESILGAEADTPKEVLNQLNQRVKAALVAANPHFEIFQNDQVIELTSLQDGTGIQIRLFSEEAALSVPFWHEGRRAAKVFGDIWQYSDTIHREAGYVLYDPQLDAILDLSRGYEASLDLYSRTIKAVKRQNPDIILGPPQQKKWWQFWKRR